jgi:two-component system LytT family response regulator
MTLSCYIIDDEFHAVEVLTDYINRTTGLSLAGASTDPVEGLEAINALQPDLIFLDIYMPGLTGIELARILNGSKNIVFTSSSRDFGPEAFDLGVSYYLLKPLGYQQFLKCMQKIKSELITSASLTVKEPFSFFVKSDTKGKLIRIMAADIIYISSEQNYLHIHLADDTVSAYLTVTELAERLPPELFCRVHRAYIVNLGCVAAVEPGLIRLRNKAVIDIGPTYREEFLQRLNSMLIVSHRERKA